MEDTDGDGFLETKHNDDYGLVSETAEGCTYTNSRAWVASLDEIEKYQTDLRSYASQLVCVLSGKAQNQYAEYWTLDLGQQIGCGTYVTKSGVVMKNTYYTAKKGVRFGYVMSESSNTGDFTDGTIDLTNNLKMTTPTVSKSEDGVYQNASIRLFENNGKNYGGGLFEEGGKIHIEFSMSQPEYFSQLEVNDSSLYSVLQNGNKFICDAYLNQLDDEGHFSFVNIEFYSSLLTDEIWTDLQKSFTVDKFTYTPPH